MKLDHKKKALEALMQYLTKSDDSDLESAMKPKSVEVEVIKTEGMEDGNIDGPKGATEIHEEIPSEVEETRETDESKLTPEQIEALKELYESLK